MVIGQIILGAICSVYSLPGPPSIKFENGTIQLYSINRRICPSLDPQRDVIFKLYTRKNPSEPQILLMNNESSIQESNINFAEPTILYFHGFMLSSGTDDATQIRNGYLHKGDFNVILVDCQRLVAGLDYITAVLNCKPIGQFSARFMDFLVTVGLKLSSLHIVGFSLGGHIGGLVGKFITSGKVARITGLDPAGPLFNILAQSERLGPNDAEFVDVIHTSSGIMGINMECGKIDIWLNGGSEQPGCSVSDVTKRIPGSLAELIFCNHFQSYRTYVQALYEPKSYLITNCSSYKDFQEGKCNEANKTYLGEDIDQSARGNYYITTGVTAVFV